MKFQFILALPLLLLLTVTGCWDQKIIEKKAFIVILGMESVPEHDLLFTIAAPQIDSQGGPRVKIYEARGNLVHGGIRYGDLLPGGDIEHGKVQHVLLSEELAVQGIHPMLETFVRDQLLPLQSSVAVVEGSPNDLVRKLNTTKSIFYFEQAMKRSGYLSHLLKTSIGDFEIPYFAPGIDPLLPIIKQNGEGTVVSGTALFTNDRMAGKLNSRQMTYLLAMMDRIPAMEFFLEPVSMEKAEKLKRGVAVSIRKVNRKLGIKIQAHQPPELKISLHFIGRLQEYRWDNMDDEKKRKAMERAIANEIKKSCRKVIRYTQQIGCDPIGFGDQVRATYNSYWKSVYWPTTYRNAKINIEVKFELVQYGLIR